MKKRTLPVPGKLVLAVAMAVSLGAVGISYAAWSGTLRSAEKLTTGTFRMVFSQQEQSYAAGIVDPSGNQVFPLTGLTVQRTEEGQSAAVTFPNGLPLDRLLEGDLLKLTFPLSAEEGTVTDVKRYEPDFTVPWKVVEMEPQALSLVLDGQEYDAGEDIREAYDVPLQFDVFRSVEGTADAMTGSLYFQLTEESRGRVQALPQTLEVSQAALDAGQMHTAAENPAAAGGDGVLVVYTCSVPVGLDQYYPDGGVFRAGGGRSGT